MSVVVAPQGESEAARARQGASDAACQACHARGQGYCFGAACDPGRCVDNAKAGGCPCGPNAHWVSEASRRGDAQVASIVARFGVKVGCPAADDRALFRQETCEACFAKGLGWCFSLTRANGRCNPGRCVDAKGCACGPLAHFVSAEAARGKDRAKVERFEMGVARLSSTTFAEHMRQ